MLSISNTTGSSLIAFSKDRINQVGTTVAGRCWNATRLLVRGGRRASTSKKANWPRAKGWWIKTASGEEWRFTHGFVEASAGRHGGKKAQQSRTTALDPRHVIQVLLEGNVQPFWVGSRMCLLVSSGFDVPEIPAENEALVSSHSIIIKIQGKRLEILYLV